MKNLLTMEEAEELYNTKINRRWCRLEFSFYWKHEFTFVSTHNSSFKIMANEAGTADTAYRFRLARKDLTRRFPKTFKDLVKEYNSGSIENLNNGKQFHWAKDIV
jgi:hypothetical protein